MSVLEVAQCAFISNQNGKQSLTDLFPFFTFALAHSLSNYGKTHCTSLLVLLVGMYVQLKLFAHTLNKSAQNDSTTIVETVAENCEDAVPFQFTDSTNGFLAAP